LHEFVLLNIQCLQKQPWWGVFVTLGAGTVGAKTAKNDKLENDNHELLEFTIQSP
jgi:hypothetical protein